MSKPADLIKHPAIVQKVEKDKISVMILSQSACAGCHAKSSCTIADMSEKIIEVYRMPGRVYEPGEQVNVVMRKSLGNKAVFLGYLLPFLIVLIALIILISFTEREGLSALISLALLAPYYIYLNKRKDLLKKTFAFQLE